MKIKICKKCVLPENFPHITFNKEGICNICADPKGGRHTERLKKEYKQRFEKLLNERAGRSEYDLLMCYSGGKDSTYTLSVLKKIYKVNILAFTFDNGFVPDRTYVNIRNVVESLDTDHILFKPRFKIIKKIFKHALKESLYPEKTLERASTLCTSCIGLVKYAAYKLAIEKDIPFIAFGWSPGQAPVTSSVLEINPSMLKNMESVLRTPMGKIAGKAMDAYFLNERHYAKKESFPILVHPLAFFPYNERRIMSKIKEFGWQKPRDVEMNTTNCLINPLAEQAHIAKYGFHPYALEIAALVRGGYMSRREGLGRLLFNNNKKTMRRLKKQLGK